MKTLPEKTEYELGESLVIKGAEISVMYSDEHAETVAVEMNMVTVPDMSSPGEKEVLISYEGFNTSFMITVVKEKSTPEIVFGEQRAFTYDGEGHAPTVEVLPDTVKYEVHFEKDEAFYSDEAPIEAGYYAMVVSTEENDDYIAHSDYVVFHIDEAKSHPEIVFGDQRAFTYDGEGHAPTVEVLPDTVKYEVHFEKDEAFYSDEAPTEVGYYAMVVVTEEDEVYGAYSDYVVFHIDAPITKLLPTIDFHGEEVYTYDGEGHAPTVEVLPDTVKYEVHFEQNEAFYSDEAPTEVGYYAMVVVTEEDEVYAAHRGWFVFQIALSEA